MQNSCNCKSIECVIIDENNAAFEEDRRIMNKLFVLKAKNEEYFKIGIGKEANTIQLGLFPYGCLFSFVGHDANSFYFILSGSVIVERMEEDKSTGEQHKQVRSYKQLSGVYREC